MWNDTFCEKRTYKGKNKNKTNTKIENSNEVFYIVRDRRILSNFSWDRISACGLRSNEQEIYVKRKKLCIINKK